MKIISIHRKSSFYYWQLWLFYSSILFALSGLLLILFGTQSIFKYYYLAISNILFNTDDLPKDVEIFRRLWVGVIGGTIFACYSLLAFIAYYPFKEKQKWAQMAIIFSFSVWVLLDSYMCYLSRVYFQIYLLNAFSIIVKALPLIFTWRDFRKS